MLVSFLKIMEKYHRAIYLLWFALALAFAANVFTHHHFVWMFVLNVIWKDVTMNNTPFALHTNQVEPNRLSASVSISVSIFIFGLQLSTERIYLNHYPLLNDHHFQLCFSFKISFAFRNGCGRFSFFLLFFRTKTEINLNS